MIIIAILAAKYDSFNHLFLVKFITTSGIEGESLDRESVKRTAREHDHCLLTRLIPLSTAADCLLSFKWIPKARLP